MSRPRSAPRLLAVLSLLTLMTACGGGGGSGGTFAAGPVVPVPFEGPVHQAFTAFGGLTDAAVDIYTYETLGQGPRHVVPTVADGSFGIPQYLVTPDTLIIVRVRGGMGSPDGGPAEENLGAWYGLFTPSQVQAETARVGLGTTALYLRLRHMLATHVPVVDVVHELHQRARCLLKADLNGDKIENADDVASDDAGAVDAMYSDDLDDIVPAIFAGDPIPYFWLLRMTEPKQPQLIDVDETIAPRVQMARSLGVGDLGFVTMDDGVLVYQYDPNLTPALRLLTTITTVDFARDIAVRDDILYVLGSTSIETFDIADLLDVDPLDTIQLTQAFQGEQIEIVGDVAYATMTREGLFLVDISDPSNLTQIGAPIAGEFQSVSSKGRTLFVGTSIREYEVFAYDITDPRAPSYLGLTRPASSRAVVATTPTEAVNVGLGLWNHVERYESDNVFTQSSYDVTMDSPAWPADTRVYGDILITAFWDGTVGMLDVHDRRNPFRIPAITAPPSDDTGTIGRLDSACVTTHGLLLFQPHQISVFSWDPLSRPDPILSRTYIGLGSSASGVQFDGDRCYHATNVGIRIFDVLDPAAPQARGTSEAGAASVLHLVGTTLYTGSNYGGMQIYDVSDPDNPTHENTVGGQVRGFDSADGRLYTGRNGDFTIFDIADPFSPVSLGTFDMTVSRNVMAFGELVYAADGYAGGYTRIIDTTDPTNLVQTNAIGPRAIGGRPTQLTRMPGDQILITGFNINSLVGARVEIVDVSDPANPVVTGHELTSGYRHNATAVRNGFAYIASDGPMLVIDVRDPRAPYWVDTVPTPRGWGVDVSARCGAAGVDNWGFITFRTAVREVP